MCICQKNHHNVIFPQTQNSNHWYGLVHHPIQEEKGVLSCTLLPASLAHQHLISHAAEINKKHPPLSKKCTTALKWTAIILTASAVTMAIAAIVCIQALASSLITSAAIFLIMWTVVTMILAGLCFTLLVHRYKKQELIHIEQLKEVTKQFGTTHTLTMISSCNPQIVSPSLQQYQLTSHESLSKPFTLTHAPLPPHKLVSNNAYLSLLH